MHRQQLMRVLAAAAFDPGRSVTYPDHPLLVRGPDIFGQDASGLVAWFVYSARSSTPATRREASRVLLSRLAFPQGTQFVAVFVGQTPAYAPEVGLFDKVQTRDSNGRLASEERVNAGAETLVEQIRPYQFERFSEAWAGPGTLTHNKRRNRGRSTLNLRRQDLTRLPAWLAEDEERLVARIDSSTARRAVLPLIGSLSVTATSVDFGLDAGIAGLSETASMLEGGDAHLALHTMRLDLDERAATRTTDPYKPYRAAAFAGARVDYPESS